MNCTHWKSIVYLVAIMVTSYCHSHAQAQAKQIDSASEVVVPFVGCKSDGQMGPKDAPARTNRRVRISSAAAQQLALFSAADSAVLAPRQWHGFETYGSAGAQLFVLPSALPTQEYFKPPKITGPGVQTSYVEGGTSGRFEAARIIARVFPKHMSFVKNVVKEGLEPASSFPTGPYKTDRLKYLNDHVVEFTTPANSNGLGTKFSALQKNSRPIYGAIILDADGDKSIAMLVVRLDADTEGKLATEIIRNFEREHEAIAK